MATWKKILVEGDAVANNLATANLTQSSADRVYDLNGSGNTLTFKDGLVGFDTSADITRVEIRPGLGLVNLKNNVDLRFYDSDSSHYVALTGPSVGSANYDITLPAAAPGAANKILESDASGNLSWIDTPSGGGGGVTVTNQANNRITTATATTDELNAEANLTFDGSTLTVAGAVEFTGDYNSRAGERYDAGDGNYYATNAKVTAGDIIKVPKAATSTVTEFKVYTLSGSTIYPELLDAASTSTNIDQIAFLAPKTLSSGAQAFYLRCMATIPASDVNGTYSNSAGDPVFLDPSNTGELTLTEPASGAFVRQMGYVINGVTISSVNYYIIWFDPSPTYIRV